MRSCLFMPEEPQGPPPTFMQAQLGQHVGVRGGSRGDPRTAATFGNGWAAAATSWIQSNWGRISDPWLPVSGTGHPIRDSASLHGNAAASGKHATKMSNQGVKPPKWDENKTALTKWFQEMICFFKLTQPPRQQWGWIALNTLDETPKHSLLAQLGHMWGMPLTQRHCLTLTFKCHGNNSNMQWRPCMVTNARTSKSEVK